MGSLALQLPIGFINGRHQKEIEGKEEREVRVFIPLGSFLPSHWDVAVSSDQRPQFPSGGPVLQSELLSLGSYNCSLFFSLWKEGWEFFSPLLTRWCPTILCWFPLLCPYGCKLSLY